MANEHEIEQCHLECALHNKPAHQSNDHKTFVFSARVVQLYVKSRPKRSSAFGVGMDGEVNNGGDKVWASAD